MLCEPGVRVGRHDRDASEPRRWLVC